MASVEVLDKVLPTRHSLNEFKKNLDDTITRASVSERHDMFLLVKSVVEGPRNEEFVTQLKDNPKDEQTRMVYADWLEENGMTERVTELMREPWFK